MRCELHHWGAITLTGHSDRIHRKLYCVRVTTKRRRYAHGEAYHGQSRIEGSEKGIIGKIKEVASKVLGDAKRGSRARPTRGRERFRTLSAASRTRLKK